VFMQQDDKRRPSSESSSPIRAAERFMSLHKFESVESVQKIETGLECGQWLLRKLIIRADRPCWA
jgi:hypothetical protein